MMLWLDIIAVGLLLIWIRVVFKRLRKNVYNLPYPPGPKKLPLIGNILDMPSKFEWETAQRWGETYGDLVYVENFGQRAIFVNSYEIAVELLERRGSKYSTRPRLVMCNELQEWDYILSLRPYDATLKKSRYVLRRFLQRSVVHEYDQTLMREARKLLYNILQKPEMYAQHVRNFSGSVTMLIGYGHKVERERDPYIDLAEQGLLVMTDALRPYMVNYIPALKYLPGWLPGCGFQKVIKEGRQLAKDFRHKPYASAKSRIMKGMSYPSIMSRLLEANTTEDGQVEDENLIEECMAIVYAAGADTTVSSNVSFILAMLLFPEVQRCGQEELDRVIGKGSLPTFTDRSNLPYINAIVKEVLRWHPVLPLGIPHCTTSDDFYNGYYIPANTTIFPNAWAMCRNSKVYPDPEVFRPERFLVEEGKEAPLDPSKIAFGFGRRRCSGEALADNTIFIFVASILATFDIQKIIGQDGHPVTPSEEYTSSTLTHALPFKCTFTPRSLEVASLLDTDDKSYN